MPKKEPRYLLMVNFKMKTDFSRLKKMQAIPQNSLFKATSLTMQQQAEAGITEYWATGLTTTPLTPEPEPYSCKVLISFSMEAFPPPFTT